MSDRSDLIARVELRTRMQAIGAYLGTPECEEWQRPFLLDEFDCISRILDPAVPREQFVLTAPEILANHYQPVRRAMTA